MLRPPRALPHSAHIAVLATSGPSDLHRIQQAAVRIESRGHRVTLAPNIDERHHGYLAGDDDRRAETFNEFLRSEVFDAYFFARGGYGAMRILERIDYNAIARNPRPIVGFSDITAIHQAVARHAGVGTFHGPMLNLDFYEALSAERERWLWAMLAGDAPLSHSFEREDVLFGGTCEGTLFGGCLALTDSLMGTAYDYWIDDGVWFWEDVDEPVYRLDRMLTHLRLSGRMQRIRGVIIGALKNCGAESELTGFLRDFFGSLQIPVVRNLPFGHHGNNLMLPIGRKVRLSTADLTFAVTEPAVVP
jgi:muramoyltetrapeptide carboxypeptidase